MSRSNIEQSFARKLLADKIRLDGRPFDQLRDVDISFGSSYGHVEVRLGKTRLVAQVSASVKAPRPERPFEGLFHISTDISSMASPQFENGRSSGPDEILVSRMIEKAIRRSNALDLESLCIVAGKRCWMVRADVHYIDYDGGLVDASCIGVIAALLHFKRPDISIEGDNVIVHDISERPPVPLSVLHVPICVSWSFIPLPESAPAKGATPDSDEDSDDDSDVQLGAGVPIISLMDATAAEQDLRKGEMTITINKDRDVCQITKAGGAQLSTASLLSFVEHAHKVAIKITNQIHHSLKQDFQQKHKGNLGTDLSHLDSALNVRPPGDT